MYKPFAFLTVLFFLVSCKKDKSSKVSFNESILQLSTHSLATYSIGSNSKYLVVFESGLGNDHSIWQTKRVAEDIGAKMDMVIMTEPATENLLLIRHQGISID